MSKPDHKPAVLHDWYVTIRCGRRCLVGHVFGHRNPKRHYDGKEIITSRIVTARGRVVETASGSVYRLGRIQRRYRRWLATAGIPYDRKQPIVMRDGALLWDDARYLPGGVDHGRATA